MSGQPLNKPRDAQRFRNAYLGTLSLQQEVDLKNYNANALYKRTGVVPSQIMDYRSTQEKMADIERLRILVRSELKEIADDKNAEDIAMELTAEQLQFVAQSMPILIRIIKPRYRYGIPKEIFIPYLVKYMNDEMENRIVQAGLSTKAEPPSNVDVNSIDDLVSTTDDNLLFMQTIQDLLDFVEKLTPKPGQQRQIVDTVKSQLELNRELYPNDILLERISKVPNQDDREELIDLQSDLKGNLATTQQLQGFLVQFNDSMTNEKTLFENLNNSLQILTPLLGSIESKQEIEDLLTPSATAEFATAEVRPSFSKSKKTRYDPTIGIELTELPDKDDLLRHRDLKGRSRDKLGVISKEVMKEYLKPYYEAKIISLPKDRTFKTVGLEEMYATIDEDYDEMISAYTKQNERTLTSRPFVSGPSRTNPVSPKSPKRAIPTPTRQVRPAPAIKVPPPPPPQPTFPAGYVSGFGIKGKGIGVEEGDKYALLGRFNIHLPKLRDDILALHNLEGKSVYRFKPRKVSVNVGNVVRKIIKNASPTFEDLSKLSEEDKQILGELIKITKIDVDIPQPTDEREDLNQFEIMKGQLLSGNDSVEMIKKFKLLILKLSHTGRLPKAQAKDLLMDLALAGY